MSTTPHFEETVEQRVSTAGSTTQDPQGGSASTTRTSVVSGGDPAFRGVQFVWFLLGLTDLVIGLRVLFKAMAATDTGFVSFIYGLGGALAAPFLGIANVTSGKTVIEVGGLIAMAVYLLAAFLVFKLIRIATTPRTRAVA
jgi:hypothetical protein